MELTENQNLSTDECYLPPVLPIILSLELKQQQQFVPPPQDNGLPH